MHFFCGQRHINKEMCEKFVEKTAGSRQNSFKRNYCSVKENYFDRKSKTKNENISKIKENEK